MHCISFAQELRRYIRCHVALALLPLHETVVVLNLIRQQRPQLENADHERLTVFDV